MGDALRRTAALTILLFDLLFAFVGTFPNLGTAVIACWRQVDAMSILFNFLLNVAGSLTAVVILYTAYVTLVKFSYDIANLEMWWLPEFKCWRVVIRNIPVRYEITEVRSNSWLRYIVPPSERSSVNSFRDIDLAHTERILIAQNSDLPVTCFRLGESSNGLDFVLTDKFGSELASHRLSPDFEQLSIQYSAKVQRWGLVKFEIYRSFVLPRQKEEFGEILEVVLAVQENDMERKFPVMFRTAEVIRVSI